jgi:hypothetical protein
VDVDATNVNDAVAVLTSGFPIPHQTADEIT